MVGEEKRKVTNNHLLVTFFRFVDQTLRISNLRFLEGLLEFSSSFMHNTDKLEFCESYFCAPDQFSICRTRYSDRVPMRIFAPQIPRPELT